MEPRTAAASVGVGILLLAWLASALSEPHPRVVARRAPAAESEQLERLRTDVETQAARLRTRLATTPLPAPSRNPFAFAPRPSAPTTPMPAASRHTPPPPALDEAPVEPVLVLIGIAERGAGESLVRTAMIAGAADDLHLVAVGEEIGGLYRVRAIGADAVELERLDGGTLRRLHLK